MASAEENLCAVCAKPTPMNTRCSRCKARHYCGRECQKQDWPSHKKQCAKPQQPPAAAAPPEEEAPSPAAEAQGSEKPPSEKKKKGVAPSLNPETDCAECGAAEGTVPGHPLHLSCNRCKNTFYCCRACQVAHWKTGGHRQRCLPPHARSVKKMQEAAARAKKAGGGGGVPDLLRPPPRPLPHLHPPVQAPLSRAMRGGGS